MVVFDEDLAAEVDAGSPDASELLDELGRGRQVYGEAASGRMQVADQVLQGELAGGWGVPAPPAGRPAAAGSRSQLSTGRSSPAMCSRGIPQHTSPSIRVSRVTASICGSQPSV